MKIFSSTFTVLNVFITVVGAIPPPLTELLNFNVEEASKIINSLPTLKSPIANSPNANSQKTSLLSLIKKRFETLQSASEIKASTVIAPPFKPLEEPRDSNSLDLTAMHINDHQLLESSTESTSEKKLAAVDKMQNKEINKEVKKRVSFSPEVSTFDSSFLFQLEEDLISAKRNALDSEWKSANFMANIDEINQMWKEFINQEAKPKKTNLVTFGERSLSNK